jgi:hypothetical protein
MDKNAQTLTVLLDALTEVGAQYALFGGILAGYYGKARLTHDVDVLVSNRSIKLVQAALERRGYWARPFPYVVKIYHQGERESVADFVIQESNAVLRAAFVATMPGEILGFPVSIVRRGVFVALKFQAATTPRRQSRDRTHDVVDVIGVIEKEFGPEDERLAVELAAKMYPGAGADLMAMIDDVRRGQWPRVVLRAARRSGLLVRRGLALSRRR